MTENERFIVIDEGLDFMVKDTITDDDLIDADGVADVLNDYEKENKELKQFQKKVFELIDIKIKHYSHKPISAPAGQPMSVNFDPDGDRLARLSELQQLKEELE